MENERNFDFDETHDTGEVNEQYHILTVIDCNVEQDKWRPIPNWPAFEREMADWANPLTPAEAEGLKRAHKAFLRGENVYWYDANEGTVFAILESKVVSQ